ncbi:MAG: hypothetical protein ACTSSH_06455 [Candidatus Heimdallarchaeota archaeon]
MPEQNPQEAAENIFDGILFSISEDSGPNLSLNLSSLDERGAIATVIHGITAVGLGEERHQGLFGPIPVPYNTDYRALIYVFFVESATIETGRFCALFLIFKKEMIRFIANVYAMIDSLLKVYQENYLAKEEDLRSETIQYIYDELVNKLRLKPRKRIFRVNNGITVEFEESKFQFGNELTALIDERARIIYTYIPRKLEKESKLRVQKIVDLLNKTEYQSMFSIQKILSKRSFLSIVEKDAFTEIE